MSASATNSCQNCHQVFEITAEDQAFYTKIEVPPPTFCPQCRLQRRLTWRNDRSLFARECDLCRKQIIALYPAGAPFPVYCNSCWYSDSWDGLTFGRDYDFSKPFFAQFRSLLEVVPRSALQIDNCIDCDFSNQIVDSKNCYLVTGVSDSQDCYYSTRILTCQDVVDCLRVNSGQRCAESINVDDSYDIRYCQQVANSSNLSFCSDVRGSSDCFMSANLRHAQYVFRGEQLSKEEYEQRMQAIDFGSAAQIATLREELAALCQKQLHRPQELLNCTDCVGANISNGKNAYHCFYSADLEDCKYTLFATDCKDTYDVNNAYKKVELVYEGSSIGGNVFNVQFSADAWPNVKDSQYTDSCRNGCSNLFGCISLRKKQYCILNKQYTPEEYEQLRAKIVQHMKDMPYVDAKGGTYGYGEFFPIEHAPFAYNQSSAMEKFPLAESDAADRRYPWGENAKRMVTADRSFDELPDHIRAADESLLNLKIQCEHATVSADGTLASGCQEQCTLVFKLIPQELALRKELQLALSRQCPNCRHTQRLATLQPYRLWQRQCACEQSGHDHESRCLNRFDTSHAPDRPEIVYCEACYQQEVL